MRTSRRTFLKGSALTMTALSAFGVHNLLNTQNSQIPHTSYFIKDALCQGANDRDIKADKVLSVNGDIREIYAELKRAFEDKALVAGQSSETTFFVLRTMAAGYGLRVAYSDKHNGVRSWILAPTSINI